MGVDRSKYKRLTDLYTEGTELELKGGMVVWLQILNPFELDEARSDAAAARNRLILALEQHGTNEQLAVDGQFQRLGVNGVIEELMAGRRQDAMVRAAEEIHRDPEWADRLAITERSDELIAKPLEDPERQLLDEINEQYMREIAERSEPDLVNFELELRGMEEADLRKAYRERWLERRGADRMMAEFRLTEVWYGTRVCNGVKAEDGTWDHDECEGHWLRLYETKEELRRQPAELQTELVDAFSRLVMTAAQAKGLGREASSSDSSLLPSEEEASTPSGPDETPVAAPGPTPSPSTTP